jgi:hypothetical protein
MDYTISSSISDEMIGWGLYAGRECGAIISDFGFSDGIIQTTLIPLSDDSGSRIVRLSLLLNPQKINSARYVSYEDDYAYIGICSRMWVKGEEIIPFRREDYVTMQADLNGMKGIVAILEDKSLDWGVDMYRCDDRLKKIRDPVPAVPNGLRFRICITPNESARDEGVYLALIKSFHFERDDIIQNAVSTFETDEVTEVQCHRGADLCVIDTVLSNEFFHSSGEIKGEGSIYLQFGYQPKATRQRSLRRSVQVDLQSSMNVRSLYGYTVGEILGERPMVQYVNIEPNNEKYSAEAFRCDSDNVNVNMTETKSLHSGETIKICIRPDERARNAGVYIHGIESFSYGRENDDKSQVALDSYGRASDDGNTLKICSNGADMCSIETMLEDWFFDDDGRGVITGYVVLQFGPQQERLSRRRTEIVYRDQSDLGFAGRSQVDVYFDISSIPAEIQDTSEGQRWELSRVIYIVAAVVGVGLLWLCCMCGCFFFCKKEKKTKKEELEKDIPMTLNINFQERDNSYSSTDSVSESFAGDDDMEDRGSTLVTNNDYDENDDPIALTSSHRRPQKRGSKKKRGTTESKKKTEERDVSASTDYDENDDPIALTSSHRRPQRRNSTGNYEKKQKRKRKTKRASFNDEDGNTEKVVGKKKKKNQKKIGKHSRDETHNEDSEKIESGDESDIIPKEEDICFEAEEHLGTEAFLEAVQQTLKDHGPSPYSPSVYKNIKRQLPGRRFFVCDDDDKPHEWREVTKRELISLFCTYYEEAKSHMF